MGLPFMRSWISDICAPKLDCDLVTHPELPQTISNAQPVAMVAVCVLPVVDGTQVQARAHTASARERNRLEDLMMIVSEKDARQFFNA